LFKGLTAGLAEAIRESLTLKLRMKLGPKADNIIKDLFKSYEEGKLDEDAVKAIFQRHGANLSREEVNEVLRDAVREARKNLPPRTKYGPGSGRKIITRWDDHLASFPEGDALGRPYPGKRIPGAQQDTHAHHIVMKGKDYPGVAESQLILEKYDIDWYSGRENLIWAPNVGHTQDYAWEVYLALKRADETLGTRPAIEQTLREMGQKFIDRHTGR
jgi:hypothetical protein